MISGRSFNEGFDVRRRVQRFFWTALALRVLAAVIIHVWLPPTMFAPDQLTYHDFGKYIASSWSSEYSTMANWTARSDPKGYFYLVAFIYYLLGPYSLLPKLLNALAGALAVPVVYDLAVRMGASVQAGLRAAAFTVWFPSLVLWSVLNIRDVWIILLILLICRQALILQRRFTLASLVLLVCGIIVLVQFRAYVLYAVTGPVLVSLVVQRSRNAGRNLVIGCLAAAAVIFADQITGGASRRVSLIDLEELNDIRYWNTVGAASQFEHVDISTPGKAILYLPKGLALFLLAPFPWELGSIRQILALPETLFFYWLIPPILRGIRHFVRYHLRSSLMAILITGGLTLGYSLGEGNAGTAYRHRAQLICFFLIFASVGQLDARRRVPHQAEASPALARPA
jgi:hypothetical protein